MADQPDDRLRDLVLKRTDPGKRAHELRCRRYDEAYAVYIPPSHRLTLPKWRSQTKVRYAQGSIDTQLWNMVAGAPRCIVHPRTPADEAGAKAMQAVLDYYVYEDHLVEKQPVFAQQALIYGVTIAKNTWYYDEDANGNVKCDRPCFEPWSVYDAWWDPNARDVDTADYVVLESWLTKDQILRHHSYDDQTGRGWQNLDALFAAGTPPQRPTSQQETTLGNVDTKRKGAFLISEYWFDDNVITLGNRRVLLEAKPNPYRHGKKPIVIAQTRPDGFEMMGTPETDLLKDIQAASWTLQNMTIDHLHVTVHPMFTYRDSAPLDPNLTQLRPGGLVPVQDQGDLAPLQMPVLDRNVYEERMRLLADMERVSGVTAYVSGADSNTIDQTTATGVTALQSAANQGLKFKAAQLHWKGFQRTFEMWGAMVQQFLTDPVYAKITGENGEPEWRAFGPDDVAGDFHYRMEGSEESVSRQTARQEALALLNTLTPYVQLGVVDAKPLVEKVAAAYDIPDPDSLLKPPAPQLPPAAPFAGGSPMGGPPAQGPPPLANGQPMGLGALMAVNSGRGQ